MKQIFTLITMAFLFTGTNATAQKLTQLKDSDTALSIVQVQIDGEDYTSVYLENDAFLAFYEYNGKLHFSNVWQKAGTQSYGEVEILEHTEKDDTVFMRLLWYYANSYDDHTGTAIILIQFIQRPVAVSFELSMLTESAGLSVYKGYVNGSLNWKPYY